MLQLAELFAIVALVGIVVGGIYKAWEGFKDNIGEPYTQAQLAADEAKIAASDKNAKAAESERDHAKSDTAVCQTAAAAQTAQVEFWQKEAAENLADARAARDASALKDTKAAMRASELQSLAGAAPKLMACEVELDKAKKTMQEALRNRPGMIAPAVPVLPAAPPGLAK